MVRGGSVPPSTAVRMPVPKAVREYEEKKKVAMEKRMAELVDAGVELSAVPRDQLESGDGPIIQAHMQWHRRIALLREKGRDELASSLEELLSRIENWRDTTALKLGMAPAAVLPDHVVSSDEEWCRERDREVRQRGELIRNQPPV